jgi:hypothetical protein
VRLIKPEAFFTPTPGEIMDAAIAREITNFAAAQWALIFLDDAITDETGRGECTRLLAQYGPAINDSRSEITDTRKEN